MKYLEKITISNVRKFSENVEIPVGKGATVFLAPNGTGKTAIFEAIELAVTGKVRRLPFPPNALIRDNKLKSFIRLDFEDGRFCEADFHKGQEPVLKGNHSDLFGSIPASDVPFLLRLTHLLNQKNSEWFVQTHGTAAGEQLDHLSIGRDAAQANSLMTSAKKAANALLESSKRQLQDALQRRDEWNALKEQRKTSSSEIQQNLIPRSELLIRISALGKEFQVTEIHSEEVDLLMGQAKVIEGLLSRKKEANRKRHVDLGAFDEIIRDFEEKVRSVESANQVIAEIKEAKKKLADEIALLRERFLVKSKEIKTQEELLLSYNSLRDLLNDQSNFSKDIEKIKLSIDTSTKDLNSLKDDLQKKTDALNEATRVAEIFSKLRKRSEAASLARTKMQENERLVEEWKQTVEALKQSNDRQPELVADQVKNQAEYEELQKKLQQIEAAVELARGKFESLNSTTDAIKEAVGHIASHLAGEATECPVCLSNYPDGELHRRVAQALQNINPLLQEASAELDLEREKQRVSAIGLTGLSEKLRESRVKVEQNRNRIAQLEQAIASRFHLKIYDARSVDEALVKLKEMSQNLTTLEADILKETNDQTEIPVTPIQKDVINLTSQTENLNESLAKARAELLAKEKQLAVIDQKIKEFDSIVDIHSKIIEQELLINALKGDLESIKKSQEDSQRILNQTNDILVRDEESVMKLSERIREVRSKWSNLGFSGDPNMADRQIAIEGVNKLLEQIDKQENGIQDLLNELTKWKSIENSFTVENQMEALRGSSTEQQYEERLANDVQASQEKIDFITTRHTALNSFASKVSAQLEDIHSRIATINPVWKKLLARIVLEPRFADTKLESFLHYKKPHANVNVLVHGEDVIASHVASEAQITDLQFTFLLAMAQKYQWSPWRALLLDDPTQHHDLVHASAVFDLLRDYIIDHDFQILLATHDSVQANFLVRKLANDGIQTKLYRLRAGGDGVKAEPR